MPLSWWHSALAVPIQQQLIGFQPLRDEQILHEAFGNASAGLLSPSFLDVYLPSQPNLLFALLILLVATVLSLLLLAALLIRTRFSGFFTISDQQTDKITQRKSRFRLLLCFSVPLWLLLLFGSVLFASTLVELVSVNSGQEVPIVANEALLLMEDDLNSDEAVASTAGREQRDNEAEGQMLRKFEVIRELGYKFRSLLSPALFTGWMAFFLLLLLLTFLGTVLFSLLTILIGLNQRFRRYSPMMEHVPSANHFGVPAKRVRGILSTTAILLLCAGPAMLALGAVFLVHSHGHGAVCVMEQKMTQDAAIRDHVQANFSPDEQTLALPEFLADLANERTVLNEENCQRERAPLENLWSSCLFLAITAIPFGICLLFISAGWDNPDREGSVSLRAYVPGWVQNAALTPDAYSSIPELNGGTTLSSRHPSANSQCSFGTGTFVYKKY